MSNRQFSPRQWDNQHFSRTDAYAHKIELFYRAAVDEAARLASGVKAQTSTPFSFDQYPVLRERITKLLTNLTDQINTTILSGQSAEWELANEKNDSLVSHVLGLGTTQLSGPVLKQFIGRNLEALAAFQTRKVAGLNLSQRVTHYTGQFKNELEMGLDLGIGQGKSAAGLSRDLRSYLNDPDKLFRRVRNKHGQLVLSKQASAYHPGQGVYRSSYKNMLRLTRTEINHAYREADYARWQSLDFVVGIEVRRSNNTTYGCDVCESLKGKYPREFKFTGWHPQCRCHAVSILASSDELRKLNQQILAGEEPAPFTSVNQVNAVPDGFVNWYNDNRERIEQATNKSLFILNNPSFIPAPPPPPVNMYQLSQASGFTIVGATEEEFNKMYRDLINGFDFVVFNQDLSYLSRTMGLTLTSRRLQLYHDSISMSFEGYGSSRAHEPFHLTRRFSRENNKVIVDHDLFIVPKSMQGKSFSKDVFKALYQQYQQANIDLIRVHANIDVGGYAWARYGFSFAYQPDRRMVLNRANRFLAAKDLPEFMEFWKDIEHEPVFPMQALAKSKWGKPILLGSDWNGVMDLKDAAQVKLFEDYLFSR